MCEGRSSPDQSGSPALPARRCLRTASPTHSVTWGRAPPASPCTCALRRPLWCHVPGASRRLLGGCFLWLSPPPPPPPLPGGRGKLGGSGLEKARFWFGSAARYATCPLPGVWNVGAAGEMEAAWVGPGEAWRREGPDRPAAAEHLLLPSSFTPAPHPACRFAVDYSRNMTLGVA